jgi:hypothetical protein
LPKKTTSSNFETFFDPLTIFLNRWQVNSTRAPCASVCFKKTPKTNLTILKKSPMNETTEKITPIKNSEDHNRVVAKLEEEIELAKQKALD